MRSAEDIQFLRPRDVTEDELQTRTTYERASRTVVYPMDASTSDWMRVVETSGTLDFWMSKDEDKYNERDGEAV